MGTSKGYMPPTGHLWSDAKRSVSGMARNNYNPDSIGKAMSNFSKANGSSGSRKEGNSAIGSSGSKAVNFAGLVRNFGLNYSLNEVGLSYLVGRSPEEVFAGLIDYFSVGNNSLQQSIADQAMQEYMEDMMGNVRNEDELQEAFSNLETDIFIRDYLTKFLKVSFFTNFAEKINSLCNDIGTAIKMQGRISEYIRLEIAENYQLDGLKNIDWKGREGRNYIEKKCEEVWMIFEMWGDSK
ncbi:hypothetical protein GCM10012290_07800 [Halolactibacillus alkaliphilus]|uniref:Uncharacterized protein n=1 Tax=Halolactibacillus alkaliphilus TaxID=442899 RepID=A0A511X0B7_9BACI|nr:hypothetical protein [Halolactibacillus alkaliphilus]GEN56392.1 hypothetical protein HAL01_08560 [Halolactibacillus alkaliphilus]GGN67376.1 hypothetical protein GCM10012290_07800 [Halolactibacillus alkaliphilus]SFO92373.1 hypothetical protein SAMN05720591_12239 [Halolactibacillus alkaliphilus]